MRENLSAPGNVSDWLKISKQALKNLNYYNINQDPQYARLSARYGYDEYIVVNIRSKNEDRVLLEFDVSSPKMIDQFKTASAQVIRKIQNDYREKKQEQEYGPTPTYTVNTSGEVYNNYSENIPPKYVAEDGDYIEQTRALPDDTLQLKQFRKDLDQLEEDSFRHKFRYYFNKLWVIWLMLIILPPFGIFLLWYFHRMGLLSRTILSALSFLYFVLIWVGFFGIDTGFNRDSIQRFYLTQQYNIQRMFNMNNQGTDPHQAVEALEEQQRQQENLENGQQEPQYIQDPQPFGESGVIQQEESNPMNDLTSLADSVKGFFSNLFSSFSGQ